MPTLSIAGTPYNFNEWPEPKITPAIQWAKARSANLFGSDRGVAQDIHETTLSITETEANITALQATLNSNREKVTLSAFGVPVFAPIVDHTGSISAVVTDFGMRRQRGWAAGSNSGVYELTVSLRAISTALLASTPSLSTLRLQEGFVADHSWSVMKAFSFNQTANYEDDRDDVGSFTPTYRQTTSEVQAILKYLLSTARANTIVLPAHTNVTYPFGQARGTGPFNVIAYSYSVKRFSPSYWDLSIDWRERA